MQNSTGSLWNKFACMRSFRWAPMMQRWEVKSMTSWPAVTTEVKVTTTGANLFPHLAQPSQSWMWPTPAIKPTSSWVAATLLQSDWQQLKLRDKYASFRCMYHCLPAWQRPYRPFHNRQYGDLHPDNNICMAQITLSRPHFALTGLTHSYQGTPVLILPFALPLCLYAVWPISPSPHLTFCTVICTPIVKWWYDLMGFVSCN